MKPLYRNGGGLPYGPSEFENDQFYAQKGMDARLRQAKRQENRAANKQGRQTGYFPARPSDVQFLLNELENPENTRENLARRGFRNNTARALGRGLASIPLMAIMAKYQNTPKQITRPQGAFGQPNTIDLNALQRLGMVLGLGPF